MGKKYQVIFQIVPPWLIPESKPKTWKIAAKLNFAMPWTISWRMAARDLLIYRCGFMAFCKKQVSPQRQTTLTCWVVQLLGIAISALESSLFWEVCHGPWAALWWLPSVCSCPEEQNPDCIGSVLETKADRGHSGDSLPLVQSWRVSFCLCPWWVSDTSCISIHELNISGLGITILSAVSMSNLHAAWEAWIQVFFNFMVNSWWV